jgi:selenophosphate synthetase-related protein
MPDPIERHVKGIEWIRDRLQSMDDTASPIMGIRDWDDAACVEFSGKLVASTDGPYSKRLVLKSALVHAATDVIVKGAKPLYALDNMIGPKADVEEMIEALKAQAEAIRVPIIGGNTLIDKSEPLCCVTVIGRLILDEPIRDRGAQKGDVVALIGEPIWGEREERLEKARLLFDTWYDALDSIHFNAAKDVTKGGLVSVVYEMETKSGRKFKLNEDIPYHRTRNLDNFIVTLTEHEYTSLGKVCAKHGCTLKRIGNVG